MARKSTIKLAQSLLSAEQFACYEMMPTKLSAAQLREGLLPPTREELEAADAARKAEQAAKKAAKAQAKADACEAKPKRKGKKAKKAKAQEPKAPQAPEKARKVFDALEEGYYFRAIVGGVKHFFLVTKVTPKTRTLAGTKGEAGKLSLAKGGVPVLKIDGTKVACDLMTYKAEAPEWLTQAIEQGPLEAPKADAPAEQLVLLEDGELELEGPVQLAELLSLVDEIAAKLDLD
jgi:hypothetical protein